MHGCAKIIWDTIHSCLIYYWEDVLLDKILIDLLLVVVVIIIFVKPKGLEDYIGAILVYSMLLITNY